MKKVLIIIPCYNEELRLPRESFGTYLKQAHTDVSILFVNDGSNDSTISVLNEMKDSFPNKIEVLDLQKNVGKAEAIRQGMLQSDISEPGYLGYFDADLATPLKEIDRLLEFTKRDEAPFFIMGSRIKLLGSTDIKRKLSRHYVGRIFATIVSNMLNLPIYDTQCGAKIIEKKVAKNIFKEPFISKWLFDVELLFRLKKGYNNLNGRIVEMPLKKWEDVAGSKIGFTYFLKAPIDLLRIYFHYK